MSRDYLSHPNNSKITELLRTIGNGNRLRILWELSDGKERSVSQIEELVPELSQSALSQHLARLRRANLVTTRRQSQAIYYALRDRDVVRFLRLLHHIYRRLLHQRCSFPTVTNRSLHLRNTG